MLVNEHRRFWIDPAFEGALAQDPCFETIRGICKDLPSPRDAAKLSQVQKGRVTDPILIASDSEASPPAEMEKPASNIPGSHHSSNHSSLDLENAQSSSCSSSGGDKPGDPFAALSNDEARKRKTPPAADVRENIWKRERFEES